MSIVIDGKKIAKEFRERIKLSVDWLKAHHYITPGLAVVMIGEHPASQIYVRNKVKFSQEVGMNSFEHFLPSNITENNLINKIEYLNNDPKVHGILVQLPLPKHINAKSIINAINPHKDVDGFHVQNIGKLVTGQDGFVSCTPQGCLKLIKKIEPNLQGLKAVIIGRSNIVGKPMAHLLLNENCTVTIAHSKTRNIAAECKTADILIAAVGHPQLVKKDWVKPGSIVIDVGISRIIQPKGIYKLVGDVDFNQVKDLVRAITPVPGGVGPMTIACLLNNTLISAYMTKGIKPEF